MKNKKENPMADKEFGVPEMPEKPVFSDDIINPQYNLTEDDVNPQYKFEQENISKDYEAVGSGCTPNSSQQHYQEFNAGEQFAMQSAEQNGIASSPDNIQNPEARQEYNQDCYHKYENNSDGTSN